MVYFGFRYGSEFQSREGHPQLSDRRRNEGFDTTPVRHRKSSDITTFGLEVVCFHARVALIHSTLLDPLWLAFSIVVRSRPSVSNLDLARAALV